MSFSNEDIAKELRREINQRRRVYARYVAEGKMTQELMDRRIAMLEQAIEIITPPSLFDPEDEVQ